MVFETEFEEKYTSKIEWSKKFGKNGWVISKSLKRTDIKNLEELLYEGKAKIAEFMFGEKW